MSGCSNKKDPRKEVERLNKEYKTGPRFYVSNGNVARANYGVSDTLADRPKKRK